MSFSGSDSIKGDIDRMSSKGLFITGTDTGCGKTEITLALMRLLQDRGYRVLGMKPVASGAEHSGEGLRNSDALRIQDAGSLAVPYGLINPYTFEPPVAPHIAAAQAGKSIHSTVISNCYQALAELADRVIVEGVGGWRVPLGEDLEVADLPQLLDLPVVLVVGMRLGCLNHALLSAHSIAEKGCALAGWVANQLDSRMPCLDENLHILDQRIPAPRLGRIGHFKGGPDTDVMAAGLDLSVVMGGVDLTQ
jgi:dethiobiotin synthetase